MAIIVILLVLLMKLMHFDNFFHRIIILLALQKNRSHENGTT